MLCRWNGDVYRCISKHEYKSASEVKRSQFTDMTLIPLEEYCPIFLPHFTLAPDSLLAKGYIKRAPLSEFPFSCFPQISEQVLKEVEVCEIIRKNPHTNLIQYHGCEVRDGRITGLCFTKYNETLEDRVNPRRAIRPSPPSDGFVPLDTLQPWWDQIKQGIQHLHRLGLVHNDLTPGNIMFDDDGRPVIIDFDSCRPEGHSITAVRRTFHWCDQSVRRADPSNDLKTLDDIQAWLTGQVKE